jgi:spore coat polysaccharide biosynthesis predicted glycosyltransferase SpsG
MKEVLQKSDFYISIYSQTLFEASCLGVPVLYYKNDTELMDTPFNGRSELVTVYTVKEIIQAFYDFKNKHERYDAFLDRKVMEKYIGPLDGNNLKRNVDFIYNLLDKNNSESSND